MSVMCLRLFIKSILFLLFATCLSYSAQFGPYTYEVVGQTVKITDFTTPADFNGQLVIPSQIENKPVTEIGDNAFSANFDLKTVTMPDTLLKIGTGAFYQCNFVVSIDFGNSLEEIGDLGFFVSNSLKSVTLPDSLKKIGERAFEKCKLRSITLPANLTSVGKRAFMRSRSLTDVVILGGETKFGFGVFQNCENLQNVRVATQIDPESEELFYNCFALRTLLFESDAPAELPKLQGSHTTFSSRFSIYFMEGKTGFTAPMWKNYPCAMLKPGVNPFARDWLLSHNLDPDIDMRQDHNGDGHSLLLAYALQKDPNSNLNEVLPRMTLVNSELSLAYSPVAPGVSYLVENSTDLIKWSHSGVNYSDARDGDDRTASATLFLQNKKFMRLSVSMN